MSTTRQLWNSVTRYKNGGSSKMLRFERWRRRMRSAGDRTEVDRVNQKRAIRNEKSRKKNRRLMDKNAARANR